MANIPLPGQSTDKIVTSELLSVTSDKVWKSGYFRFTSSDFSAVTGGYLATRQITLYSFSSSDPGTLFSKKPHFAVYHYTKDGTASTIYDGTTFEIRKCDFTVFDNFSTGAVNRSCVAYLSQSYSVPNFTVKLNIEYFTKDSTGFTYAIDGINYFFYMIYTTNLTQALAP